MGNLVELPGSSVAVHCFVCKFSVETPTQRKSSLKLPFPFFFFFSDIGGASLEPTMEGREEEEDTNFYIYADRGQVGR